MTGLLEPELHANATPALSAGRWMQVLSHLDPKYGGISTVVPFLAAELAGQGTSTAIEAFCVDGEQHRPALPSTGAVHFWPIRRFQWFQNAALRTRFDEEVRRHDGVHVHGLWDVTSAVSSRAAIRLKKPYVLSSHGMLEPWALNHGRLKKQLYSFAIERDVVRKATCLHALTDAEALQYREYTGGRIPTVVIPNGVSIPQERSPDLFIDANPQLRGRRIVLFLARLHPKKGVDLLVQAWRQVVAIHPDAFLVLAGPDAENMTVSLQETAAADGTQHSILFAGMLKDEAKWSALAAAECLVLPSHSEGLSMSVLEAMGAGVPVLVTPQCNMPWVSEMGAGWLTRPDAGSIAESLVAVLGRSRGENSATGRTGSELVRKHYSWASVAQRMAEVYRWCLGGEEPTLSEVMR